MIASPLTLQKDKRTLRSFFSIVDWRPKYKSSWLRPDFIAAVIMVITIVALTPLFYSLPEAILGIVVIHAVWHLISFKKLSRNRKITNLDFWTSVVAVLGVLFFGILQGLVLAVGVGLLALLLGTKTRSTSILGKVPGEKVYRGLENFSEGETFEGLLILRFDGSLYFANAPDFADEVRAGIEISDPKPQVVLIGGESINSIDATAISTMRELEQDGIRLWHARIRSNVMKVMERTDIINVIGRENFHISVQDGVDAFLAEHDQD